MTLFLAAGLPETDNDLTRGLRGGSDGRRLAAVLKKWREVAGWSGRVAGLQHEKRAPLFVSLRTIGQSRRDPGASMLVGKAIVDGLLGHFGDHRTTVIFLPAEMRDGRAGVEVEIGGVS